METERISTAQIGKCGELLVQFMLLRHGIESARLTTDAGIDLVAYSPKSHSPMTIQVKAVHHPKPSGGKGKPVLDWWIPDHCPAQLVMLVDLDSMSVWVFDMPEIARLSPQHSGGKFHLGMYSEEGSSLESAKTRNITEFTAYLLNNRIADTFGRQEELPIQ